MSLHSSTSSAHHHHRGSSSGSTLTTALKFVSIPLAKDVFDPESATVEQCWRVVANATMTLFQGEGLKVNIETLNSCLGKILRTKSHSDVVNDLRTLLVTGMAPMRDKLVALGEDKLIHRTVEVWMFFNGTLLPYFLGIFEPLQMHPDRVDLPTLLEYGDSASSAFVRDLIVTAFRKEVLSTQLDRLKSRQHAFFGRANSLFFLSTAVAIDGYCGETRPERRNAGQLLTLLQIVSLVSYNTRDEEVRSPVLPID